MLGNSVTEAAQRGEDSWITRRHHRNRPPERRQVRRGGVQGLAASMVRLAPHAAVGASGSVNRFVAQERVNPFTIASSRLFQGWIIS